MSADRWVMVPVEPTGEMLSEGSCAMSLPGPHHITEAAAAQCWALMREAALREAVALTTDQLIALCAHGAEKTGGLPHDELDLRIFARAAIAEFCRINGIGAPMTDRPTSAPQPVAWWVPVTERLPEKNTEVLICFEGQNTLCSTGQYTGSAKDVQGWCYPWENRGATDDGDDPVVTHWMPLPAPPGEEPPLYDQAALDAVRAEERERWSERDDIHTESSRIYARLAGAVRAGADDASLARLLRHEVSSRSNPSTHTATPQEPK